MDKALEAIVILLAVHFVGLGVLVWMMLEGQHVDWRGWWWPKDEPDEPVAPRPDAPGGERLPLPTARPASVRLRTAEERLADAHRLPRRPEHAPGETPAPSPPREPLAP